MHNPDIPNVQAHRTANGINWRITCPHCHHVHVHGAGGGSGHRVAHCEPGTPGKSLGYYLLPPVDDLEALA